MKLLLNPDATPSVALAAAPVIAATPPVTPSAPVVTPAPPIPMTEADMARAASLSLREPAEPTATPATPAAIESPAAAVPPVAPVAAVQPPIASIAPPEGADDLDAPLPDIPGLGDPGKRALQAERDKRKAANTKLTEALAEVERLKAQPAAPVTPAAPGQPAAPSAPTPSVPVPTDLARCDTFEQVTAVQANAAALAANAMQLNTVLATGGIEAAKALLQQNGLDKFQGVALNDLTAEQLAASLSSTWQHSMDVQANADRQKAHIHGQRQSFAQAVTVLPGLKDPGSAHSKVFDAIVAANPAVKQLGHNWPLLVAHQIVGMEAAKARSTPTAAPAPVPALTPAPAPMVTPAPGAPRTAVGHVPAPTELDAIQQRVAGGKATEADMARYASSQLRTG